jgi:geranylgeranyl transferase type-2 subunit alpha
MYHGRKK